MGRLCVQHDKLLPRPGLFAWVSSLILNLDQLLVPNYFLPQLAKQVTCRLLPLQLRSILLRRVVNRSTGPGHVLALVSREDGWRKAQCTRSAPRQGQQPTLRRQTEHQVCVSERRVGGLETAEQQLWSIAAFLFKIYRLFKVGWLVSRR